MPGVTFRRSNLQALQPLLINFRAIGDCLNLRLPIARHSQINRSIHLRGSPFGIYRHILCGHDFATEVICLLEFLVQVPSLERIVFRNTRRSLRYCTVTADIRFILNRMRIRSPLIDAGQGIIVTCVVEHSSVVIGIQRGTVNKRKTNQRVTVFFRYI